MRIKTLSNLPRNQDALLHQNLQIAKWLRAQDVLQRLCSRSPPAQHKHCSLSLAWGQQRSLGVHMLLQPSQLIEGAGERARRAQEQWQEGRVAVGLLDESG